MQLLIIATPPHLPNATTGSRHGGAPACQAPCPISRDPGSNWIGRLQCGEYGDVAKWKLVRCVRGETA